MKRLSLVGLLALSLIGCSSSNTPTPQKLSQDMKSISTNTAISVVSQQTYSVPRDAQIIEETGLYRVIDNIYDTDGYNVLIPRGALVSGMYANDGLQCHISWKSIYVNKDEYENNRGTFTLGSITAPSTCAPTRGIKKGDRIIIKFTGN